MKDAMTDHKAELTVGQLEGHAGVLKRIGNELRQKCRSGGGECEICEAQAAALDAAIAALTAAPAASEWEDGAGVAFDSAEALADWLETLHEADGPAVMCGKWEPAQVAARAIREHLTRPAAQVADLTDCRVPHSKYDACHNCDDPQVTATPKHDEGRDFDTWHDSQWPAPGRHAPYGHTVSWRREKMQRRVVWEARTTPQPAARRVTDDPRVMELLAAAQELADEQVYSDDEKPDYEPEGGKHNGPAAKARNKHQRAYWRVRAALESFANGGA